MTVRNSLLIILFLLITFSKIQAQFFFESAIGQPVQVGQIKGAEDVAFDAAGNIYVASGFSRCVMKFSPTGTPISQIGTAGNSDGQFNNPIAIALDASGNIYVADAYKSQVLKFNNQGVFQNNLATAGAGNGQVNGPSGIAIDGSGNIYVSDTYNHRIQKFNSSGTYTSQWGSYGTSNVQFAYPIGIAVDASNNVYVVDSGNARIMKFNSIGSPNIQWGSNGDGDGQFNVPQGIAIDASGNIYVSEQYGHRIKKFNILGQFVGKFGEWGAANNQLYFPKGLEIDAAGNIYVADRANDRVQKITSTFVYSSTIGTPLGDGQLDHAHGVTLDASGNIYVADGYNHQIQKFNSAGVFLTRWGSFGTGGNGQFNVPYDIAIDGNGDVYVVDGNDHVQKFSSSGVFKTQWGSGTGPGDTQFNQPRGIAIDANNMVYVADMNNHRVLKFNNTGTLITKWGSLGIGELNFNYPEGIALDGAGNVYVADGSNSRIQKFTNTGTPISRWGSNGSENGNFFGAVGISISGTGKIYVTSDNRFQQFDNSGDFLASYFAYGFSGGSFMGTRGIEVDPAGGGLYVADVINGRILKFSVLDIISLSTPSGIAGSSFTITGSGFSATPSENVVKINGVACQVISTSPTSLVIKVPSGATTGKVSVTRQGFTVTSINEFLVLPLAITSFTPGVGSLAASITISGTGFSSVKENNKVKFNGIDAIVTASTATSITATVPAGNTIGKISVTVNGVTATSITNFDGTLSFNSFTPSSGLIGSSITLSGTGFSSTAANQVVKFNGTTGTITSSSLNSLTVTVPAGATTGKISVAREGSTVLSANEFLVLPLAVTSFTPAAGIVGTPVTINGTGFSSVNGNNSVTFNGVTSTVTASTPTRITTTVPVGSTTGKISITVAGQATTSVSDFIVTKLGISQTNFPEFFTIEENGATVTLLVNDINEVQSIKINRRGITEDDSKLKVDAIPFTTSGNTVNLSVPASYFTDPLGLYCWFSIMEKAGNDIVSQSGNIYLKYPASSSSQAIPDLKSGKSGSAYQLVAVPLDLTAKSTKDVFGDLESYDNKKWRLFSLANKKLTENPSTIETGKGYWFIMRDQTEINPGSGTVVKATKQTPYKLSLSPGWNLIGNPYNFSISWDDVLDHNGLPEEKLKFRQFLNGTMTKSEPILNRYRGGFVESDIAREIEIPVINRSPGSGRRGNVERAAAIDEKIWELSLALDDGEFRNELLGIGMHPRANENKDVFDEEPFPMLEGISSFNMAFTKSHNLQLATDIVTSQESFSWNARVSADKPVTIEWDNSFFGNNQKQLVVENVNIIETTDMRLTKQLILPGGNHELKFHYGNADYIKDQLMESSSRIGNVFPNPIKKSEGIISVAVSLPEGDNEVSLRLKNLLGQDINYSGLGQYEGGRRNIQWQSDFSQVPSGMYLMQIEVKDAKGINSRITRRIIFE